MTIAKAYEKTEATWPAVVPPVTAPELQRAAKRLFRTILGSSPYGKVETRVVGGKHRNYPRMRGDTIWCNPDQGWKDNVHGWSHSFHRRLHSRAGNSRKEGPGKPHSKNHARLEARMIREVLKRGWLDGVLKPRPLSLEPQVEPAMTDPGMRKCIEAQRKLERINERIARWESKAKRAENALRKLARQKRYYERRTGA